MTRDERFELFEGAIPFGVGLSGTAPRPLGPIGDMPPNPWPGPRRPEALGLVGAKGAVIPEVGPIGALELPGRLPNPAPPPIGFGAPPTAEPGLFAAPILGPGLFTVPIVGPGRLAVPKCIRPVV